MYGVFVQTVHVVSQIIRRVDAVLCAWWGAQGSSSLDAGWAPGHGMQVHQSLAARTWHQGVLLSVPKHRG